MKLGIMQPYFFPYLGHFALISAVDEWIVFDVTQYTPKSWINRNRVLHPKGGWNYLSIPLEKSSISIKIFDATVSNINKTEKSVLGKLSHYKNKAPFYNEVISLVKLVFNQLNTDSLVELNVATLKVVCNYLNIPFKYQICSDLNINFPENMEAGEWAPTICKQLNATEYLNPSTGIVLFDRLDFKKADTRLLSLKFTPFIYPTGLYSFEENLSVLDVLMWNEPSSINAALQTNTVIE